MPDGSPVEQYTLRAGALSCDILTYGGALRALRVPDAAGAPVDVLLGFDSLEDYRRQDKYMGALVGRYANRIGGASFSLNGQTFPLAANDGSNHLHGGDVGFDKQVWRAEMAGDNFLTLSLTSPDGQEGYPGTLHVQATYTLERNGLSILYLGECSRDTLCNLTNHAYFNLSGHASGPVGGQTIQIFASQYTPTDNGSIPTGEIAPVEGTSMDLRNPIRMDSQWDSDFPQLVQAGGFDHNWIIDGWDGALCPAARAWSPDTAIQMEVLTTLPGVQFYSGNYLDNCPAGKGSAPYAKRWGFCLETQCFPDSPHQPHFPSPILRTGERYASQTVYRFSSRQG